MNTSQYKKLILDKVDYNPKFEFAYDQFARLFFDRDILQHQVDQEGYTYKAGDLTKPNPAVAQLREVQKQILTFYTRFGLTDRDNQLLTKDLPKEEDFSEFDGLKGTDA